MLLNNFLNYITYQIRYSNSNCKLLDGITASGVGTGSGARTGTLNYTQYATTSRNYCRYLDAYFGICIGSGTTPPTKEDYQLETPITTGVNAGASRGTSNLTLTLSQSITASSEPIEINEIGVMVGGRQSSTIDASGGAAALLTRTVLPQTLIINPGETRTITVSIDFNKLIDNTEVV